MRPDASRFIRPDAARYLRPDWERYFRPLPRESKQASDAESLHDNEQIEWQSEADRLRFLAEVASLRFELAMLRLSMRANKALHRSNFQPRVPAGSADGGQFADGGGERIQIAQRGGDKLPGISSPGGGRKGHHYMPQGVFKKYALSDEALAVFDKARSGLLETQAIGSLRGHQWDGPKGLHKAYNDAVEKLFDKYLSTNNIAPQRMTSDQAWSFLKQIERSEDPRIRNFNATIRLLRMLRIFRGRGSE